MPNDIDAVEPDAPVKTAPPNEPDPPQRAGLSPAWMASSAVMMITGAVIGLGTFFLARGFAAPPAPGQITAPSGKDSTSVTPEEVKAIADRLDQARTDLEALSKKVDKLADPDPALKELRDTVDTLSRNVAGMPALIDSLSQKLETVSKAQTEAPSPKLDEINKKVADLAQQLDAIRTPVVKPATTVKPADDVNVQGQAMEQAADLFAKTKYAEARDAFVKLQSVYPNDARVWYYSALANGLATNKWTGETEKWVTTGMDKEKAGTPAADRIDAVFTGLTTATGKDWLAAYRGRIAR